MAGAASFAAGFHVDDIASAKDRHRTDLEDPKAAVGWLMRNVAPEANPLSKGAQLLSALALYPKLGEATIKFCDTAVRIAGKLGLSQGVQDNLAYLGEPWDGRGSLRGVRGQFIPVGSRIVGVAQTVQVFSETGGAPAAQEMALQGRGKSFDPQIVDAFLELSKDPSFWQALEQDNLLEAIWAMEPSSPYSHIPESRLDDVATAFAEFIDMKSPYTGNHSRGVAVVAERLARRIGLSPEEVTLVKRAGLLHDLGKVSVSNNILDKKGKLNAEEWERMRLHPYYTERILTRVEALRPLAVVAGAHHEWMNGNGYFRQLSGPQISKPAHIIAISDMFHALSEERPYRPALETEKILQIMEGEAGNHLCRECLSALKGML